MAARTDSLKGNRVMSTVDSPEPVVSSSVVRSNAKVPEYELSGHTELDVPAPFGVDDWGRACGDGSACLIPR